VWHRAFGTLQLSLCELVNEGCGGGVGLDVPGQLCGARDAGAHAIAAGVVCL